MPKKCAIATLYYHSFERKIRVKSLKKWDLAGKMLGKCVRATNSAICRVYFY